MKILEKISENIKRGIALTLAGTMFLTMPQITAFATGDTVSVLMVNGTSAAISGGDFTNAVSVAYGDPISLTMTNAQDITYTYLNGTEKITTDTVWKSWDAKPTAIGNYYLGCDYTDSDGNAATENSGNYGFKIVPAVPDTPQNLAWTGGSKASWSAVTKKTTKTALESNVLSGYKVTLYKDKKSVAVETTKADTTSYDFTDLIEQNGGGTYTFTVQATVSDTTNYTASAESEASAAAYAVSVSLAGDDGIKTLSPSTETTLIAKNSTHNSLDIAATMNTEMSFAKWTTDNTDVAIKTAADKSTTVSIADTYQGAAKATITGTTTDTTAPVITSFAAGTGDDSGKLTAEASDAGSKITAYAFTRETDESKVEWTDTDQAPQATIQVKKSVSAAGDFYFYVKDKAGNITRSTEKIQATKVVFEKYYEKDALTEKAAYVVGETSLSLPTAENETFYRDGYDFDGWYTSADTSGSAVTTISRQSADPIYVYGKWTRQEVTFTENPQDVKKNYDGTEATLTAAVKNSEGTITYQWYKDGQAIAGETKNTLTVKNVADSGEYYVEAAISAPTADGEIKTGTSSHAVVQITPATLTVTAASQTITYQDPVPAYSYASVSGFAAKETAAANNFTEGTYTCAYNPAEEENAGAKTYTITPSGFSVASNYTITYAAGTLTVAAKDITQTAKIQAIDKQVYTGEEIKPVLTISDGTDAISATQYTAEYTADVNAGTATVTVTFSGNYTGTKTADYTIDKATFQPVISFEQFDSQLNGWYFDETTHTPTLDTNPGSGAVTYTYKKDTASIATNYESYAPGNYTVTANVAETANYYAATATLQYSILPRPITITAESQTWTYDGNAHTNTKYTVDGSFVGTDSFQSIVVAGTITDVGTADNTVTYTLSTSTEARRSNYNIQTVSGKLTVNQLSLTEPSNPGWSSTAPGTAEWVAVTRSDLTVQYCVSLYRKTASEKTLVKTVTTEATSYNFAEDIRSDSSAQSTPGSYAFTVQALSSGGSSQKNYADGKATDLSKTLYTARLTVAKSEGIATATISAGALTQMTLLQGESQSIAASKEEGYSYNKTVWITDNSSLVFSDAAKAETTVKASSSMTSSATATITACSTDDAPTISTFSAAANAKMNQVTFTLTATDTRAISKWAVTTSKTAPEIGDAAWSAYADNTKSETVTYPVTTAATYYAYVMDNGGNITKAENSIGVYQIDFAKNGGTGDTMASLLKIQDATITLPANTYTLQGDTFKCWSAGSGQYADKGSYSANKSETLTAQWTNQQYTYTAQYFEMGTDGTYAATPTETKTYAGAYGTEIKSDLSSIQISHTGMELDTTKSASITLTQDNQVLAIYYKRTSYKITYSYTLPGATEKTTSTVSYLYGQTVTDLEKPTVPGYTFVGWVYDESGTMPVTMPNKDISATATFKANETTYKINYYTQNLTAAEGETATYTLTSTEEVAAYQADTVSVKKTDARTLSGYSIIGVTKTTGSAGGSSPDASTIQDSAEGTVSAVAGSTLNINYYYTRQTYKLTLNLWKGNRNSDGVVKYTHTWEVPYGTVFTNDGSSNYDTSVYASYGQNEWPAVENCKVSDYADWSTGSVPTVMPAGDITVSRDYISTADSSYQVQIYYEDANGAFQVESNLKFYASTNTAVTMGKGSGYTIDYTTLGNYVNNFSYYEYDETQPNVMSGTVTDVSTSDPLVLKIYFARVKTTTTLTYYYNESNGTSDTLTKIGSFTISGKWGTKLNCQPTALFKGTGTPDLTGAGYTYTSQNAAIGGTTAENYNFLQNGYVAAYYAYYYENGQGHWPSGKLDTDDSLTSTDKYISYFGQSGSSYVNVYYTKPVPDQHYDLKAVYTSKNRLANGDKTQEPLTETIDGTTYNVYVGNKADIVQSTYVAPAADTTYPGLEKLNGTYTYKTDTDGNELLQDGYKAVTVTKGTKTGTYYEKTVDGENRLYIADAANQFFLGNRTSFNFQDTSKNPALVGYASIESYLSDYQTNEETKKNNNQSFDASYSAAYIYNNGFSSIVYTNTKQNYYTYTFAYQQTYTMKYCLDSTGATDSEKYVYGKQIMVSGNHSFSEKAGYHITWYTDASFENKASDFKITGDTTLFGRYEKDVLTCHEYRYYELPDDITLEDGTTTDYITAAKESSVKDKDTHIKTETTTESTDFTDEFGRTTKKDITITNYTYDGELFMVDKTYPALAFSEVTMYYANYVKAGFTYDSANAYNVVHGSCQSTAIDMAAYYIRDVQDVSIVKNTDKTGTAVSEKYRTGSKKTIKNPTKNGYTFAGWTWQKLDSETKNWTDWTDYSSYVTTSDTEIVLTVPDYPVQMTAKWTPGDFSKELTYYFQGTTKTYDTDGMEAIRTARDAGYTETETMTVDKTEKAAVVYYKEAEKTTEIGVSIVSGETTFYYSSYATEDGKKVLKPQDLIAATRSFTFTSEGESTVGNNQISITDYPMYSYAFTRYQYDTDVLTLANTDTFKTYYDMTVDYFYTRASDYRIQTEAIATDGGAVNVTLRGAGTHFYGEKVTLGASVAAGYTLKGWYKAGDVLTGYPAEYPKTGAPDLGSYTPITDFSTVTPVSTAADFECTVTESADYVAVVVPTAASDATAQIAGTNQYEYGYAANENNMLCEEAEGCGNLLCESNGGGCRQLYSIRIGLQRIYDYAGKSEACSTKSEQHLWCSQRRPYLYADGNNCKGRSIPAEYPAENIGGNYSRN